MSDITQKKLSFEDGQNLAAALQQRRALREQKIQSRETEATLRGLDQHITKTLNEYAENLLACWFVIETEYDPLVTGFSCLLRRGQALNARHMAQQLQAQKQHEAELAKLPQAEQEPSDNREGKEITEVPPNVIPLDTKGHGIVVAPNM